MNLHTKRRKRHRANQIIRCGKKAVRKHAKLGGRTGGVWVKQAHGTDARVLSWWANCPDPVGVHDLGGGLA